MKAAPKPTKPAMPHVAARLDVAVIERLDALAVAISPPGSKPLRSIALRACVLTGLDVLERQYAKGKGKVMP